MMRVRVLSLLIGLILVLAACSQPAVPDDARAPTPVDLYLAFQPDVQFAPFYVGLDKGYWADRGLAITISHQSESDAVRLVGTEAPNPGIRAAVVSGEQVLLARAQDIPVVYVFEWYERFPVAVASKHAQGIVTVNDLAGHSVGVPMLEGASYIGLRALLSAGGLSESDIDLQATGFTQVETLATDRVDAVVVYAANEPVQLDAQNIPINLIEVSDVAALVSNGIVVSEEAIANQPDVVRALVEGFAEALQYTIDHPDEAFEISKGYVEGLGEPDIEAAQKEVLTRSIDLWRAERPGESQIASWMSMQEILRGMGMLTEDVNVEAAFTNDFLPE